MRRLLKTRNAAATVLGIVAVVLAATGAAVAASHGGGAITACVHKTGGGLYRATHCAKHDSLLTWNAHGAQGPIGSKGDPGPKGNTGSQGPQGDPGSASGFAFVLSDGTVVKKGGSTDIAIHKIKTGEYCLKMSPKPNFSAPILATIQGPDLTAGLISVNTTYGSDCGADGGLGVFTMNTAGAAADHDFVVALMGAALGPSGEPGA